jgi:hypothetical protein
VYLARGADEDALTSFRRFARSYRSHSAGADHDLFVIFKGFSGQDHLRAGREALASLDYLPLYAADDSFDIGAYAAAAAMITHDRMCCLNTFSEILGDAWLGKLAVNHDQHRVGIVGATGSFESLRPIDARFPDFPNIHLRSNAFLMARLLLLDILSRFRVREKIDAYMAESGPASLTRCLFEVGLTALVVGRDGRGYPPPWWPASQTFRQGTQSNLLVADNATRTYDRLPWSGKQERCHGTWGRYLQHDVSLLAPGWLSNTVPA